MARVSFQKRQKEMKRQEKQKMKAEKRAQKKIAKKEGPQETEPEFEVLDGPPELMEDPIDGAEDQTEQERPR